MKMKCVGIGKTVGAYGLKQVQIYVKRIQRFMPFEWIEIKEVKHHKNNPVNCFASRRRADHEACQGRGCLDLV